MESKRVASSFFVFVMIFSLSFHSVHADCVHEGETGRSVLGKFIDCCTRNLECRFLSGLCERVCYFIGESCGVLHPCYQRGTVITCFRGPVYLIKLHES